MYHQQIIVDFCVYSSFNISVFPKIMSKYLYKKIFKVNQSLNIFMFPIDLMKIKDNKIRKNAIDLSTENLS